MPPISARLSDDELAGTIVLTIRVCGSYNNAEFVQNISNIIRSLYDSYNLKGFEISERDIVLKNVKAIEILQEKDGININIVMDWRKEGVNPNNTTSSKNSKERAKDVMDRLNRLAERVTNIGNRYKKLTNMNPKILADAVGLAIQKVLNERYDMIIKILDILKKFGKYNIGKPSMELSRGDVYIRFSGDRDEITVRAPHMNVILVVDKKDKMIKYTSSTIMPPEGDKSTFFRRINDVILKLDKAFDYVVNSFINHVERKLAMVDREVKEMKDELEKLLKFIGTDLAVKYL